MTNIADQASIDKRNSELEIAKAERAVVIRTLAAHRGGRNFLWWLMEQGSPFQGSMRYDAQERGDPMRTAYAEGWRGLGALITGEIMEASPDGYVSMLTENRNVKIMEKKDARPDTDV